MPITLDEFIRSLQDTGLVPLEEVTSLVSSLSQNREGVDVEKVAKELVRQQKLTKFQASTIFRRQSHGLRMGDYIVLDKIGSGGMGQVFKAECRRTGKLVALKLLRASVSKMEMGVARFDRESKAAQRLQHPNLVSVSDAGEWNGLHYLVMEWVDGRDIRALIKDKGPLSVAHALHVIIQAARGLEYAHQQGVVHRDIKPANLLLDKSGRVVILDLGLARLDETAEEGDDADARRLTLPGDFVGTVEYASPEQTADAHEVDGRSDIYSLACTFYYLLRGQPPYRKETVALVLLAHCQEAVPQLGKVAAVPQRLESLFQRMMAKRADNRPATMTEVVAELEACQRELKTGGKTATASAPAPTDPAVAAPPTPKPPQAPPVSLAEPPRASAAFPPLEATEVPESEPDLEGEFVEFTVKPSLSSGKPPEESTPANGRHTVRFWLIRAGVAAVAAAAWPAARWLVDWVRAHLSAGGGFD